ncbi:uncharacterized protein CC84DRAFT_608754 [Paraphaeosphaeria sporulosa]|uniref:Uncharacterized protein n=1 Tax=Paraphaeosphaeria sporulosa TaxID=1460663 RepID=A0A177BUW9_9PLEO|nr:uncharacterized protein CC84DRAFT_608754 [Paraphaeosphaeria sporulosa]OAF98458.1 hypothetical protein CC84DRAFT_608754 [Paraphaeosphaeria sporulosa]
MESTIPNERRLRQITVATLLPAFPLIVASGAMYNYMYGWNLTVIYFGLIPTFFSAITSVIALKAKHDPLAKRAPWVTGLWVLNDLFLALANLAILIPVWITDPVLMRCHANWMMLETYATVFLMSNMFIHAYLALYPFKSFSFKFQGKECPHCHGKLGTSVESIGTKREGYSLLRSENYLDEQEAEASTGAIRLSTDSDA